MPFTSFEAEADTAEAQNVSEGVENIVKRARQMTEIEWTPKKNITGWGYEYTYEAGVTYKGLPYGQPTNANGCRGDYVPWEASLDKFLAAVNDETSLIYTSSANYSEIAPYYSVDCSGFVSWAWDLPVRTTASGIRSYATLISTDSYEDAEIGDCLCNASAHVTLITDVTRDSNGKVTSIEISESNVGYDNNYCCYSVRYGEGGEYTLTKFMNKFINRGYYIYRSNTRDQAEYTHSCAVPLEGDNCDKCGYSSAANARDFIESTYPSYAEIVTKAPAKVYSFPCTSEVTSDSLNIHTTTAGETLTATALCLNTNGEYWYKVSIDGAVGYIYGGDTGLNKLLDSDITATNIAEPKEVTVGNPFNLGGVLKAVYNKLTKIEVQVTSNGTVNLSSSANVINNSYNLKSSYIDSTIIFNDLLVGNYDYEIYVTAERYYTSDGASLNSDTTKFLIHVNPFKVISDIEHDCDKGSFKYAGEAHPHYSYYECSQCGLINEFTDETNHISTCTLCRPEKPVLAAEYQEDCSGEIDVSFSWEKASNVSYYALTIYEEQANGNYMETDYVINAESGVVIPFTSGKYKVILTAYNENFEASDGNSHAYTDSDEIYITVSSGHEYESSVKAPDCISEGYTLYVCKHCKDEYKEDIIPATGIHTYSNNADATCNVCDYVRVAPVKSVPMYRMYDKNGGEHFYTGSTEERDFLISAGWSYEGVGFNFPAAGKPVYRLYEPITGEHLYTMDLEEKAKLIEEGWNDEGVAFNSADEDEIPQYRLHNPNASRGAYHFTGSTEERDILIAAGWEYQGIGFYSCKR
ncbi:MAG: hypothetical protein J6M16_07830 [Clostridia bacterium]|nr:hypothetical protein [Clostridia bacterium]